MPDRTRLEYEGLACRGLDWRVVAWLVIWLGLAWLGFQPALRLSGNGCFVGEACLDSSCLVLSCLALASPDLTGIPEMTNMNPRQPRTGTQRGSSVGKNSQLEEVRAGRLLYPLQCWKSGHDLLVPDYFLHHSNLIKDL